MKTKIWKLIVPFLIFVLTLSACNLSSTGSAPAAPASSSPVHVAGWNLDSKDSQIDEVLFKNYNASPWLKAFKAFLNTGGRVDVFFDCDDGRVNAGSQFYASMVADGLQEPFRFEVGTLAGQVTPEMITWINKKIDLGQIRSISISSHTCDGSKCGAQGVKADLEAGKAMSEFDAHGVGEAARWIEKNIDSANPGDQVSTQVIKVFEGTGGRVPVYGWVSNHSTQHRMLYGALLPKSMGNNDGGIGAELIQLNRNSSAILGPKAKAQGLDTNQSFRRIVVTDSPIPVEVLLNTPLDLDEAFNASYIVPDAATPEQVQSALGDTVAGVQYALAHANPETEFLFLFHDEAAFHLVKRAVEQMQVYKDFLANPSFQEVAGYLLDQDGMISRSLLIKPAYTAITLDLTIGPEFRGNLVIGREELDGQQWAVIHGGDPETWGATMVSIDDSGEFQFARTYTKLEYAKFHYDALGAGDSELATQIKMAQFGKGGGIVYTPDFGEELLEYLHRTGNWSELPELIRQAEELLVSKCKLGFCSTDAWHLDQFMVRDGKVRMSDWSPKTTISGSVLLQRFASPAAYQLKVRVDFQSTLKYEAAVFPEIAQYPVRFPALTESSYVFTGSAVQVASADAIRFEQALINLGSTDPELVAAARNDLLAMGAKQLNGQWVIGGERSLLASGPIRLSVLKTVYPDGATAFAGFQTSRFGVLGFERTYVDGVNGWKVFAPRFSLDGKMIAGIPAGQMISQVVSKGLSLVWVGAVAYDASSYATQTDHMAGFSTNSLLMTPPIAADHALWDVVEPGRNYVSTKWDITPEQLQSGCNGTGVGGLSCGANLPADEQKPLLLYNGLAGVTVPQDSFPGFGVEGSRIDDSWSYQLNSSGGYTLWLNGAVVPPGTSGVYDGIHMDDYGIWFIPYQYQHSTATCAGLCVQQGFGGEQFMFSEGAQPQEVELCPDASQCKK